MTSHDKKSQETKNKLSAALKKLMKKKDFQKITINELVQEAKLNRNSFYYHFDNIFDLLKYTFDNDTIKIIKKTRYDNYDIKKTIYFIMDYIDRNKSFCICAYKSLGTAELKKFLRNNLGDIIVVIIDEVIDRNGFRISEDFRNYIIYSHTELIATHIIGYLEDEFHFSKKQITNYTLLLFHNSIMSALRIADAHDL